MKTSRRTCIGCLVLASFLNTGAQQPGPVAKLPKVPYYIDPNLLTVQNLLPDPPARPSADLAEVHHIEQIRTAQEVAAAKVDDGEEDIFEYRTVLGPSFTPQAFPITATLGAHVKNEESVVGGMLKRSFQRPRPYQVDTTLHPVCQTKPAHDSYPSGHALSGYLEALTLAELLPDRRDAILRRADEYAQHRVVCGVHYPSDIEASRRIAYTVFGYLLATPKFQNDLAAARQELRAAFGVETKSGE